MKHFPKMLVSMGFVCVSMLCACEGDDDDDKTDRQAPSLSFTGVTDGQSVSGVVSITVTATDESGISEIRFYVDDALEETQQGSPCIFQWDITTLATGSSHTLYFEAVDGAGNIGTSNLISVTIDEGQSASGGVWVLTTVVGSSLSKYDSQGRLVEKVDVTAIVGEPVDLFEFNPTDGAFWLGTTEGNLYHLNAGFEMDGSLSLGGDIHAVGMGTDIYEKDGSLYAAVTGQHRIVKVAPSGSIVMDATGFDNLEYLAVDQRDGSVWFSFRRDWMDRIGKLDPEGRLVVDIGGEEDGYMFPFPLAVSPVDGAVWFMCECYHCSGHDNGHLVALDETGTEIYHLSVGNIYGSAYAFTFVDAAGNPWFNHVVDADFIKMSPAGQELSRVSLEDVDCFSSLPGADAVWIRARGTEESTIRKIASDGTEITSVDIGEQIGGVEAIP